MAEPIIVAVRNAAIGAASFARLAAYRAAEAKARSEGVGVWGRRGGDFHSAQAGTQN
jgi:endonuclease YncB( thermonuclease family)